MTRLSLILPIGFLAGLSPRARRTGAQARRRSLTRQRAEKDGRVAANFRTTQADFEWDTIEKVIDEVDDVQIGTIYYRRNGKDIEMMAEVKKAGSSAASSKPEPKYVLFSGGKIRLYQPKADQVTEVRSRQKSGLSRVIWFSASAAADRICRNL